MSTFTFTEELLQLARRAEEKSRDRFAAIEQMAFQNTAKVLEAFQNHRVSDACFGGTTGYGYDDLGRDKLEQIYAQVFGAEAALVRSQFVNGTHTIAAAMYACVSAGDVMLSATGNVYDTLQTVTGQRGRVGGTFADYGIEFRQVPLQNGMPDLPAIQQAAADPRGQSGVHPAQPRLCHPPNSFQRSSGGDMPNSAPSEPGRGHCGGQLLWRICR